MSENKLIKEFQSKDVNRIRNIVNNKFSEKTQISIGYNKVQEDHQEGDIWEENGKQWTIKNGIKQNISKFESLRKSLVFPLSCPSCKGPMKTKHDKECFQSFNTCFTCVIKFETQLRIEGKYDQYLADIQLKNTLAVAEEYRAMLISSLNENNDSFVTEGGDVENWEGNVDKEKITENINSYIDGIKDSINKNKDVIR